MSETPTQKPNNDKTPVDWARIADDDLSAHPDATQSPDVVSTGNGGFYTKHRDESPRFPLIPEEGGFNYKKDDD